MLLLAIFAISSAKPHGERENENEKEGLITSAIGREHRHEERREHHGEKGVGKPHQHPKDRKKNEQRREKESEDDKTPQSEAAAEDPWTMVVSSN